MEFWAARSNSFPGKSYTRANRYSFCSFVFAFAEWVELNLQQHLYNRPRIYDSYPIPFRMIKKCANRSFLLGSIELSETSDKSETCDIFEEMCVNNNKQTIVIDCQERCTIYLLVTVNYNNKTIKRYTVNLLTAI